MTIEEAKSDLDNTLRDEVLCREIAVRIARFIRDSGGEDRSKFRTDVLKWDALAEQATRLKAKIRMKIDELEKKP